MCGTCKNGLIDTFPTIDKILCRSAFFGMLAVAVWGIATVSPFWAWVYAGAAVVFNVVGFMWGLCTHCPYPYKYADCLFFPHVIQRTLLPYRGVRFSGLDKMLMLVGGTGLVAMPLIWLWRTPVFLTVFLLLAMSIGVVFSRHYCRRCRNVGCPINKAPADLRKQCLRELEDR